jgi:hypothetical protein
VVPLLVRIVDESDALGADHEVVIETLGALAAGGSDDAVPTLAGMARRRAWFGRGRLRALKESQRRRPDGDWHAASRAGDAEARQTGDRLLKRIVAAKG